jgi:uncharacterized protein
MSKHHKKIHTSSGNSYKEYYVKGMHCASCEVLINKEVSKMPGVDKVKVSLADSSVKVYSDTNEFPKINTLDDALSELGYTFHNERPKNAPLARNDVLKVIGVFAAFIVAFYLLEKSSIFMRFSVNSSSPLYSYFIFGMVAGLSSCAALVGGLLLSLSSQWNSMYNGNSKKSILPFVYFNTSRLLAFAVFGGILGLVGSAFKVSLTFSSILSLGISVLMIVIGFQMLNVSWFKKIKFALPAGTTKYISDESNFKGKYMPLIVGAATFFVPCGFTLIAQTNALSSGSVVRGALMLTLFALGTLPILALISFSSVKLYSNPSFSKKFSLFAGLLIVFFAFYTINAQLNVLGLPSLSDIKNPLSSRTALAKASTKEVPQRANAPKSQTIQLTADGFSYSPRSVTILSGVKTTLQIYNKGAVGCAQAVYARGLYSSVIYLKPGLNSVEFTPTKKGVYKISCSMGMVPPVTVRVN